MLEISWISEEVLTSQGGLCSVELLSFYFLRSHQVPANSAQLVQFTNLSRFFKIHLLSLSYLLIDILKNLILSGSLAIFYVHFTEILCVVHG
jgi:ABC-type anion transport system duplicated permease subunit